MPLILLSIGVIMLHFNIAPVLGYVDVILAAIAMLIAFVASATNE